MDMVEGAFESGNTILFYSWNIWEVKVEIKVFSFVTKLNLSMLKMSGVFFHENILALSFVTITFIFTFCQQLFHCTLSQIVFLSTGDIGVFQFATCAEKIKMFFEDSSSWKKLILHRYNSTWKYNLTSGQIKRGGGTPFPM